MSGTSDELKRFRAYASYALQANGLHARQPWFQDPLPSLQLAGAPEFQLQEIPADAQIQAMVIECSSLSQVRHVTQGTGPSWGLSQEKQLYAIVLRAIIRKQRCVWTPTSLTPERADPILLQQLEALAKPVVVIPDDKRDARDPVLLGCAVLNQSYGLAFPACCTMGLAAGMAVILAPGLSAEAKETCTSYVIQEWNRVAPPVFQLPSSCDKLVERPAELTPAAYDPVMLPVHELQLMLECQNRQEMWIPVECSDYQPVWSLLASDEEKHARVKERVSFWYEKHGKREAFPDPDAKASDLAVTLHQAARYGNLQRIQQLVGDVAAAGSDDPSGYSPLELAVMNQQWHIMQYLLRHRGVGLDRDGVPLFSHLCAVTNDPLRLEAFWQQHLPDQKIRTQQLQPDHRGRTAIHHAVSSNQAWILAYLARRHQLSVDAKAVADYTPLHDAMRYTCLESAEILLAQGSASLSVVNFNGDLPLHHAMRNNNAASTRWLYRRLTAEIPWPSVEARAQWLVLVEAHRELFDRDVVERLKRHGLVHAQQIAAFATPLRECFQLLGGQHPQVARHLIRELCDVHLEEASSSNSMAHFEWAMKLAATASADDDDGNVSYLIRILIHYRQMVHRHLDGLGTHQPQLDLAKLRQRLRAFQHSPAARGEESMTACTAFLKSLLAELWNYAASQIEEKHRRPHALIGLGSMAEEAMCPYSNLDFALVIRPHPAEEGQLGAEVRTSFQQAVGMFHLLVLAMGQTPITNSAVLHVNYANRVRMGLCFSQTRPTTEPNNPLHNPSVFLGTVADLVSAQHRQGVDDLNKAVLLSGSCFLAGSDSKLAAEYHIKLRASLLPPPPTGWLSSLFASTPMAHQTQLGQRALLLLQGSYDHFSPAVTAQRRCASDPWPVVVMVKDDLWRFPARVISCLGLFFNVQTPSHTAILQALAEHKLLSVDSKNTLCSLLELLHQLRCRLQVAHESASERLCLWADDVTAADRQLVLRAWHVAVQLQPVVATFLQHRGKRNPFESLQLLGAGMMPHQLKHYQQQLEEVEAMATAVTDVKKDIKQAVLQQQYLKWAWNASLYLQMLRDPADGKTTQVLASYLVREYQRRQPATAEPLLRGAKLARDLCLASHEAKEPTSTFLTRRSQIPARQPGWRQAWDSQLEALPARKGAALHLSMQQAREELERLEASDAAFLQLMGDDAKGLAPAVVARRIKDADAEWAACLAAEKEVVSRIKDFKAALAEHAPEQLLVWETEAMAEVWKSF